MTTIRDAFDETVQKIDEAKEAFRPNLASREVGKIISVSSGIVRARGLPHVGFSELVRLSETLYGLVFNVEANALGIIPLGDCSTLRTGDEIERTGRVMDVPVGPELLGRVINPLGEPLDEKGPVNASARLPVERPAHPIVDRSPVEVPLQTGIKIIDALVPVGRGQRELILGDRKTGKTSIAIDTILNQRNQNVICIYCAISQRAASVAKSINLLRQKGAMEYTVVVVSGGDDPSGLNFIAPYAATSIGEYFMEQGRDVLIVYDDLIQHANYYREISLLLKRPPGRAAFPGDIFYVHSRLLERATHLRPELGGGSLTALPIVETEAQNMSAYIATNLISITDGQIYLSPTHFSLGVLPAVDVSKSVSRVGGKAQLPAYRQVAGPLKLAYAQSEELEEFARFGARVGEQSQKIIERGRRIRACLKQAELSPVPTFDQIVILLALSEGLLDSIPVEKIAAAQVAMCRPEVIPAGIRESVEKTGKLSDSDKQSIISSVQKALAFV